MPSVRPELTGREQALDLVGALLDHLRAELSTDPSSPEVGAAERTLLMLGEPGIGKTSLLEAAAGLVNDRGGQVRWVAGRPEEAGLAFSGLDALLHPWRSSLAGIDAEDRAVFEVAVRGEGEAAAGTLALAGALLRLLSRWSDAGPLLVLVDDLQWVDRSTQDLLSLCARRLDGEPIGFLLASRPAGLLPAWTRQTVLHRLENLDDTQAANLLDSLAVPPQGRTRLQVMRQAGGNPLALVELARVAATRSLTDDRGDVQLPLTERLEQLFAADLDALPKPARTLLLLAAVADLPDLAALAEILGDVVGPGSDGPDSESTDPGPPASTGAGGPAGEREAREAWSAAEKAGLLTLRSGVIRFRHPLVQSSVLAAASFDQRSQAHLLLATAPGLDEDRRVWHRAAATVTADEAVAAALEATAERARHRGGFAAAATTLERAAQLSPRTNDRVRRLLAAASSALSAGYPRWVADLTAAAAADADTPDARADADMYAGWTLSLTSRHDEAMDRLMSAADLWATTQPEWVLDALSTAATVAYISGDPRFRAAILDRYRQHPAHEPDYRTAWIIGGCDPLGSRREALAHLRQAAGRADPPLGAWSMLGAAAWALDETEEAIHLLGTLSKINSHTSTAGANATVASAHAMALFEAGRWPAALSVLAEAERATAVGGLELATVNNHILAGALAAARGDSERARRILADTTDDFDLPGTRTFEVRARQARALAAFADSDHQAAYFHLSRLFHRDGSPVHFHTSFYGLADMAASAVRIGRSAQAQATLDAATEHLPADLSPRMHLILCRARGILTDNADTAEDLLREAAFDVGADQWPFERALALADLGEWLRRRQRPMDARVPLSEALELFRGLGADAWSIRTAGELRATGVDSAEARREDAAIGLTPQQLAIVQLAAEGLSNKEIAARLFLSPRTVGFHLNRAFPKLGVTTRRQLRNVVGPP
ncbi:LuxR C-terminal-related transcriptional regulator [Streptomyces sp. NPDC002574]|uniref:helix-turn-helix transcriptional regulator n=1 Tax=Streptomyces sp. NPDC002574 TaxID=3364652 RepID=UPI0036CAE9C1